MCLTKRPTVICDLIEFWPVLTPGDNNSPKSKAILLFFDFYTLLTMTHNRLFTISYENAYIAMSVHEFLAPVITPSLLHFDPLGLQEPTAAAEEEEEKEGKDHSEGTDFERLAPTQFFSSLHEMPWYSPLKEYCENVKRFKWESCLILI